MNPKTPPVSDSDLFRQSVGAVRAIKNVKVLAKPESRPKPYPKPTAATNGHQADDMLSLELELEKLGAEDSLAFLAANVSAKTLRKLRRGDFAVDAELDLHGLTSNEAKQRLLQFLAYCATQGSRCVHIIHGKGYHSENNMPVLKNQLNQWLRQHPKVLAFCSASQRSGGTGALVVLLKVTRGLD